MNCEKLEDLLKSEPKEANNGVIDKWKDLGQLKFSEILDNCSLDELDIDTSKLEYRENVTDDLWIKSGYIE